MRVKLAFYIFYIFLIKNILLSTDVYDLDKYKKLTNTADALIIFNSNDFQIDEEIYLKIYGYFIESHIDFKFIDTIEDLNEIINIFDQSNYDVDIYYYRLDLKTEYSNKHETVSDNTNNGYPYDIRYYTIEKSKSNLNGKEGKYLAIFTYMYGYYDIENTKENQGNSKVVIICVVVGVVVIAAIIFIIYYCYRKKKLASIRGVQNNNSQQVNIQNNANANNNFNNGYNNNYNNNNGYNNNGYNNNNGYDNNGYNNNYNNNNAYNNNGYTGQ